MSPLDRLWKLVLRNPVRAQAVLVAGIALLTAFGLNLTVQQVGALTGFSSVVLAFLTERAVTPVEKPTLPSGTVVNVLPPSSGGETTTQTLT